MKKLIIQSFTFWLIVTSSFNIYAIDIDTDDIDLEINFQLAPAYTTIYPLYNNRFYLDSGSIEFLGEYEKLSLTLDLDFTEYIDHEGTPVPEVLEDFYLNYKFSKQFQIRFGQFKIPFGEEPFMGLSERPYLDHYHTTRQFSPGRNQGIMLYGKKVFGFLGYKAGVFNTSLTDPDQDNQFSLSTAGKIYFSNDITESLSLKTGYSLYRALESFFAHSLFLKGEWQVTEKIMFNLFCEYMEERYYNYFWSHGIMTYLACRAWDFEPYFSFESFDRKHQYRRPC